MQPIYVGAVAADADVDADERQDEIKRRSTSGNKNITIVIGVVKSAWPPFQNRANVHLGGSGESGSIRLPASAFELLLITSHPRVHFVTPTHRHALACT